MTIEERAGMPTCNLAETVHNKQQTVWVVRPKPCMQFGSNDPNVAGSLGRSTQTL